LSHPESIGQRITVPIAVSDPYDQLYKGVIPKEVDALSWTQEGWFERLENRGVVVAHDGRVFLKLDVYLDPARFEAGEFATLAQESLQAYLPEVRNPGLFAMLAEDAPDAIKRRLEAEPALIGKTIQIEFPVSAPYQTLAQGETPKMLNPRFTTAQMGAFDALIAQGIVSTPFNWELFFNSDSRFPERAGLAGAITGTFYMLLVCLGLSFPIGVAAAVHLEEFAPKNRFTDLIEVNINNLAAVPSVVFGLLGLAVFLGFFGLPRSAPLVGGMVLSLITLPTIIIATRAALKAVPPSIREAALGIGASKHQVVLHHVLPLALPGILTGTILGMAHALGETAPLLLIGMNAFIPSVENMGILEPATTLPTQIYSWADSPERGFVSRTSAAILVLLGFLIAMNLLAIILRQRFQRRW
jgi:phosphate transport system permease protein